MNVCSRWSSFNIKHIGGFGKLISFPVCTVQIETGFIGFQRANQFEDEDEVGFKFNFSFNL